MRRRVELTEKAIGPGAVVRLKRVAVTRTADLLARWRVIAIDDNGTGALVNDVEDYEDQRWFDVKDLERVSGGVDVVVGYEYVKELEFGEDAAEESDEAVDDDLVEEPTSADAEGSLFDDPIALQMQEDREDEDYDG